MFQVYHLLPGYGTCGQVFFQACETMLCLVIVSLLVFPVKPHEAQKVFSVVIVQKVMATICLNFKLGPDRISQVIC
jgi:hypothetical protein